LLLTPTCSRFGRRTPIRKESSPKVSFRGPPNRELPNVSGHRDSRHEGRNRGQVDPPRSLWLDLKAENLHERSVLGVKVLDDEGDPVNQFVEVMIT
jgi:hypothetical protein